MDEYNRGMDPEIRRHFRKIISSFTYGFIWIFLTFTFGIFFGLGDLSFSAGLPQLLFYMLAVAGLGLLLYYYYRIWKRKNE